MDPITVVSGLTIAGKVLTSFKKFSESLKDIGKTEIVSQLIDLQMAMTELIEKYNSLSEENQFLKEKLNIRNLLECHYNSYWVKKGEGYLDGPFCLSSWDKEEKLVRMKEMETQPENDGSKERIIFRSIDPRETVAVPTEFIINNKIKTINYEDIPLHKLTR